MRVAGISLLVMLAGCGADPAEEMVEGLVASYSKEARVAALVVSIADDGRGALYQDREGIVSRGGVDWLISERRIQINPGQYRLEPVATSRRDLIEAIAIDVGGQQQQMALAGETGRPRTVEHVMPNGRRVRIRIVPPKPLQYKVEEVGIEEVAGRRGQVWRISVIGDAKRPSHEVVMSSDRDLAAIGRMIRLHMAPDDIPEVRPERIPGSLSGTMQTVFGKGTMLRLSMRGQDGRTLDFYRLEKVERTRINATTLALPGRILDQTELGSPYEMLAPSADNSPGLRI